MRIVISAATWYAEDQNRVETFESEVRRVAEGHEVVVVPRGGDLPAAMGAADIFFPLSGHSLTEDVLEAAPDLKWVHLASAGVEHALFPALVERPIILTNAAGVYRIPIAEHVLGMMLALSRGFPQLIRMQDRREWTVLRGGELYESTALIVGLGGIGRRVARLCRSFEMRVLATRNHPRQPDRDADRVYGPQDLTSILPEADWVVLCAPGTQENRHIIGPDEIAAMKPSAHLINIARGSLVDEAALVEALRSGRISGAGLDVFEEEPLPPESPLWTMPNVFVSPHSSGSSPRGLERTLDLFLDNLRRYLAGQPLRNVVNKQRGY